MICSKCNRVIPDNLEVCPYCRADIDINERRCPNCWAKLGAGTNYELCPKCGCDIEKRIREITEEEKERNKTFAQKLKSIPLWIRLLVPLAVVIVVLSFVIGIRLYNDYKEDERAQLALEYSENYAVSIGMAVDRISEIAEVYNREVYEKEWLDHTSGADAIKKGMSEEITTAKRMRSLLESALDDIEAQENNELSLLANEVYHQYTRCYGYVIGEKGSYPGYMTEYEKILKDFDDSMKDFEKAIEMYK